MLDFSQTISHHLFQPQVSSNSCNVWCIGRLHLMGLCLLSHWQAETFNEDLNESLGEWTFLQIYICVSVAIAMCVCVFSVTACKSPQSSSNSDEFICTSVLFISSPCMRIVTKYFCVQEWEKWNTWVILGYLSRYCRKANISLLLHLLHSSWRREVLYLCSEVGVFFLSPRGQKCCLY